MEVLKSDNGAERLPVVDAEGRVVGSATRAECHDGSMLRHPVVHLHVINGRGELYLQHRPKWKQIQPDRWDTGCLDLVGGDPSRLECYEAVGTVGNSVTAKGLTGKSAALYTSELDSLRH